MRRLIVSCAAAASAAFLLGAAPRPIALDDLRRLVSYGNVAIAPDARHVAAIERRSDYKNDTTLTRLVLVDVKTRAKRVLTPDRKNVQSAVWSPNGDRIAFLSAGGEKKTPQIWVLPVDGGEAMRLTDAERGVEGFAWRRDGREIAYVTPDEPPNKKQIDAHDDAFTVTREAWTARAAATPSHIWVIRAGGGTARRLTSGTWSVAGGELTYRPDGRAIAFTRAPDGTFDTFYRTTLALADTTTGKVTTFGELGSGGATFDRAGRSLTYVRPNATAKVQNDIILANSDGSRAADLGEKLDLNPQGAEFLPDGAVVTEATYGTRSHLFTLDRAGTVTMLRTGEVNPNFPSVARDGTLAFSGSTATDPSEIYVARIARDVIGRNASRGAKLLGVQRLTSANAWLASRGIGTKRTIAWRAADGTQLDAVITEPPGFTKRKKYPLVLVIHGGPTAATREQFNGLAALMAARGWLVMEPNYRGSDNHGAKSIASSLGRPMSVAGRDILDGVAVLEAEGSVDASRIGVSGWSAGGMMTSWLITHDTRWRAAFSGAGVDSLLGVATMSDVDEYAPALIGGDPWKDDAAMKRALEESPLTYADRVKTPTLIVTDAGDQRVPTPISYEFYHAIRATGTPVELLVYPVNGHFPSDPLHAEDVNRRWIDWFAKHF
ncbi:MAG TPA: S9 family peptidase [Candidatus Elarobacter sp.]|jgi:dipeptidyl aminopeptidase/acylaminoacyl peptidase|nr:S9 family peptidase [Candidatus Elarobacter sp.]